MIRFRNFLEEDEHESPFSKPDHPDHDLWKHAVPAIKTYGGTIKAGKRGEAHWELVDRHKHLAPPHSDPFDHFHIGFYHTKNKTFHDRTPTRDMDSTDLMTKMQRDRYMQRAHSS